MGEAPRRCAEAALSFQSVHKVFRAGARRKVVALRGVTFQVSAGEVFALLGQNGAGKTTLVKLALGLLRPSAGGGTLLGRPLGDALARRDIGFQPEQPYLYPFLSVRETLRLQADLAGIPGRHIPGAIERSVAECGLEPVLPTQVRRLSRGWLQRVVLAAALLGDPALLLLDEPMSGLDPEARLAVKQLIRRLRAAGKTVVFSSHVLPDVEQLADRMVLLHSGQVIACGTLDELLQPGSGGHEVEVQGRIPAALAAGAQRLWERPAAGRELWWVPALESSALQALLKRWIEAGIEIASLVPRRETLEVYFTRAMAAARAGAPANDRATPREAGARHAA